MKDLVKGPFIFIYIVYRVAERPTAFVILYSPLWSAMDLEWQSCFLRKVDESEWNVNVWIYTSFDFPFIFLQLCPTNHWDVGFSQL